MNNALKWVAFAAVTFVGFGVADTTHAAGTRTPPAGGMAVLTAPPDVSGYTLVAGSPDGISTVTA